MFQYFQFLRAGIFSHSMSAHATWQDESIGRNPATGRERPTAIIGPGREAAGTLASSTLVQECQAIQAGTRSFRQGWWIDGYDLYGFKIVVSFACPGTGTSHEYIGTWEYNASTMVLRVRYNGTTILVRWYNSRDKMVRQSCYDGTSAGCRWFDGVLKMSNDAIHCYSGNHDIHNGCFHM